jgi:hypothetical protein
MFRENFLRGLPPFIAPPAFASVFGDAVMLGDDGLRLGGSHDCPLNTKAIFDSPGFGFESRGAHLKGQVRSYLPLKNEELPMTSVQQSGLHTRCRTGPVPSRALPVGRP